MSGSLCTCKMKQNDANEVLCILCGSKRFQMILSWLQALLRWADVSLQALKVPDCKARSLLHSKPCDMMEYWWGYKGILLGYKWYNMCIYTYSYNILYHIYPHSFQLMLGLVLFINLQITLTPLGRTGHSIQPAVAGHTAQTQWNVRLARLCCTNTLDWKMLNGKSFLDLLDVSGSVEMLNARVWDGEASTTERNLSRVRFLSQQACCAIPNHSNWVRTRYCRVERYQEVRMPQIGQSTESAWRQHPSSTEARPKNELCLSPIQIPPCPAMAHHGPPIRPQLLVEMTRVDRQQGPRWRSQRWRRRRPTGRDVYQHGWNPWPTNTHKATLQKCRNAQNFKIILTLGHINYSHNYIIYVIYTYIIIYSMNT